MSGHVNQSINLLGNEGPKTTYKSQYTTYNDYSPRQCIQYVKKIMRRKKQFTNYVKCLSMSHSKLPFAAEDRDFI